MAIIRTEANQPENIKKALLEANNVNLFSRHELEAKFFWTRFDSLMQHIQSLASFMDYAKMPKRLGQVYLDLISNNLKIIKDLLFATYGLTLDTTSNSNLFKGDYNEDNAIGLGFWAMDYQPELERINTIASKWINYDISPKHLPENNLTDLFKAIIESDNSNGKYDFQADLRFPFSTTYAYAPYQGKDSEVSEQQIVEIDDTMNAISSLIYYILGTSVFLLNNYDLIIKDFRESNRGEMLIQGWRRDYSLPREQLLSRLKEKADLRPWVEKCCLLHEGKIQRKELFYDSSTPSSHPNKEMYKTSNWLSIFTISSILQEYEEHQNSISVELPETSPQVTPSGTSGEKAKTCFVHDSDFVKDAVKAVVKEFYLGEAVNLTLIEVVLYDHHQLKKRSSHKAFLKQLKDWDALPKNFDVKKTANAMSAKIGKLPKKMYKEWSDDYFDDRQKCINIGKKLPDSMGYGR